MPGPPMQPDHKEYQPIILIIKGNGGRGKSTFANSLSRQNKDIYWLATDAICSKYTGRHKICKIEIAEETIKHQVLADIINKLNEVIAKKEHSIILVEGFCCKVLEIEKHIGKHEYIWLAKRNND